MGFNSAFKELISHRQVLILCLYMFSAGKHENITILK